MGNFVGLWLTAGRLDSGVHMAEEIKGIRFKSCGYSILANLNNCASARRSLHLILVSTVAIGFVTMLVTALTMCFCILDLDAVVNTPTGVPILQIFHQATKDNGASVFLLFLLLPYFCMCRQFDADRESLNLGICARRSIAV